MKEEEIFSFVYKAVPDGDGVFYSVCCYNEEGIKIKDINKTGEKEVTEKFCGFLNDGKVHPSHLEDIFDDYFG